MAADKLFAVYLGGRAAGCNTELHDVVFVTGGAITDTCGQLLDKWFGTPEGLHLDSWIALDVVDGYRVTLSDTAPDHPEQLFFVNLGAYRDGIFTELHAIGFYVAAGPADAKRRAKATLFQNSVATVHTDDLHNVDDCIAVGPVNGRHAVLTKTEEKSDLKPNNGYHIIPEDVTAAYSRR